MGAGKRPRKLRYPGLPDLTNTATASHRAPGCFAAEPLHARHRALDCRWPRLRLRSSQQCFRVAVCPFEQRVPPFDVFDRFVSDEVHAGEVPLVPMDDAEQSTRTDTVKAGELGRAS